ncbi:DUF3147 family protein [Methylocystis sp. IM3]|jgi:hypothetical protein|uniref:DUF3147 family protein n=1 Tax=unclassified Methylocystis TaxID=2625913 RepID=UPI0030F93E4A
MRKKAQPPLPEPPPETTVPPTMLYYAVKVLLSALLIVAVSEIAKRSTAFAAFVASLPLTSLLAFVWLRIDGEAPLKIAELSAQIFWLIIPSLVLFPALPLLIRYGFGFWASLGLSIGATAGAYLMMVPVLRRMGVGI